MNLLEKFLYNHLVRHYHPVNQYSKRQLSGGL